MSASKIKQWFATAAGNNTGSPPDYPSEQWAPSAVNDTMRQMMADIRLQFEDGGWFNWNHTITFTSTTEFQAAGALSSIYQVGRRVRAEGTLTGTIEGSITAVDEGANTDVTVLWDSGNLNSETLQISVGPAIGAVVLFSESDVVNTTRTFNRTQSPSVLTHTTGADGAGVTWDLAQYQVLNLVINSAVTPVVTVSALVLGTTYTVIVTNTTTGRSFSYAGATVKTGDNAISRDNAVAYNVQSLLAAGPSTLLLLGNENFT